MLPPFLNKYAFGMGVNKTGIPAIKDQITFMSHSGGMYRFRSVITR
jgi:hypothetical protein